MLAAQDVALRCKDIGITALHIKLRATGGNRYAMVGQSLQKSKIKTVKLVLLFLQNKDPRTRRTVCIESPGSIWNENWKN